MDIKCTVCGEPWEAYGIGHGDMLPWQATLFRAGAGCPSCEGVLPDRPFEPETISDVENGDGDPMERINAYENRDNRPAWKAPDPVLLYKCDACGVEVCEDPSEYPERDRFPIFTRKGDPRTSYRLESDRYYSDDEVRTGFTFAQTKDKPRVCPGCVEHCAECGTECCSRLSTDTYDGLASFPANECGGRWTDAVCIDCFERLSSEEEEEEDDETEVENDV
jgi:hypothetical protein